MRKHAMALVTFAAGMLAVALPAAAQVGGEEDGWTAAGSARAARASANGFWDALGDATLGRLVEEGARGSYRLRAAGARVEGADAAELRSALGLAPIVTANAGYQRRRFSSFAFPGAAPGALPDEDVWSAGLTAAWELDVFGRLRGDLRAERALHDAAEEDLRDTEVAVSAEIARNYFVLRGAQERLEVARRNAENQRRTLQLTETRLGAGRGTELDAERARAQLASTEASIPLLEAEIEAAEARIAVLVGRPPDELSLDDGERLPELPEEVPGAAAAAIVRSRPDVLGAERRIAAGRARVQSARADYLPRIVLAGDAGYTASALDAFGNTGTFNYAFGPVLSWAAFDIGRVKARVDEATAQEMEARAQYDEAVLRAQEELRAAWVRYRTARERLEHLEEAAEASARAADLARLRYEAGATDFLQVLDAERTLLLAQDELARGRQAAADAYVELYEARGGVWDPAAEAAEAP
ncbi:MAG TPA: TolC family protein [Longimicrobiales bacterium]|nr:TolC family protein [Longimicrobiales bacterium]